MAQIDARETAWARARDDFIKAAHTVRFWAAEVISLPAAGALAAWLAPGSWSSDETALFAAGVSISSAVTFAIFIYSGTLVTAPYRQRNEARRALEIAQHSQQSLNIQPGIQGGVVFLKITNRGEDNEFQVQVEELDGIAIRGVPVHFPYLAPWFGLMEAIPKDEEFAERRGRRLMNGGSGIVTIATLRRRQTEPPHYLLQFWSADYMGGFFVAHPTNDEMPAITLRANILSADTPQGQLR